MTQPKIPPGLREELAEQNLCLWACQHPLTYDYEWTGNGPKRGRTDTKRVDVQLSGPGLMDFSPWGHGETVRAAVDDALRHPAVLAVRPGLNGAMGRLALEVDKLVLALHYWSQGTPKTVHVDRTGVLYVMGDDLDDDVPF